MKKILFIISVITAGQLFSQTKKDSIIFSNISKEIMNNGKAYNNLRDLTQNIGHRLSGSLAYEKSVQWAVKQLKDAGADKVWTEEVMVPVWERGKESLQIKTQNGSWKTIKMLSLGNSEGTKGKDLIGEIIVVKSFEEFNKLSKNDVQGKIVLFNYPFSQDYAKTMQGYSDASKYRTTTASLVAEKGGKAVLVRSISTAFDDIPHTGSMRYKDNIDKIPAVALGPKSADELEALIKSQKVTVKLNSNCGMKADKLSYNVIGEITGKSSKDIIVVGGHLDSWDVGEGAHDDGAGIVQSIEVLRAYKQLGLSNKNTIRVVCFANEENGVRGGTAYAKSIKNKGEKNIFALESDSGGYSPRGIALDMSQEQIDKILNWKSLFLPYGIYDFDERYAGTDIHPMKESGTALAGLVPDSQRYFDIHHSENDTFDKVNRRELLLGATVITQLIYMIDNNW